MPSDDRGQADSSEAAFWASSSCAEHAGTGGSSVKQQPEPGTAVLVGPPRSGKTTFLASLGRAFESRCCPEWTRFVPGRKLTQLMSKASSVAEGNESASSRPAGSTITYAFQLGFRTGSEQSAMEELEVSILDTPGAFFDALVESDSGHADKEWMNSLACAARNARCLVLCVPAVPGTAGPKLDLSPLVNQLLALGPGRLLRLGAKPWPATESPWERAPRLLLPFDRVLILLTGIETLCNEISEWWAQVDTDWLSATPEWIQSLAAYPDLLPREVADLLDPLAQVQERVDGLNILLSSLKPNGRLAVSGISAAGLDVRQKRDRDLFPQERGQVLRFGLDDPQGLPFGIWPSLFFLITGQVIPPLAAVGPDPVAPATLARNRFPSTDVEHP